MNPVKWIQETKRIHGICPCCGEVFRLSDATIYTRDPPPKTAFDKVRESRERLERAIDRFEMERDSLRDAARERGVKEARARLKEIAPTFIGRGIDPQDVKVIFDPVRYVVFRGLRFAGQISVELVDDEPTSSRQEKILSSINRALERGNAEWRTWRVTDDGSIIVED